MENDNSGLDQVLLASSPKENWTKETAAKMLSSCTWRIFETEGVYACEEFLGNGEVLTYKFELGKEMKFNSSERGDFATGVFTSDGKGSFLMVAKDKKSGVVSEFKFYVDEQGLSGTWSIPKTGESSKLRYARLGDCQGTWKLISRSDGFANFLDALGLTANEKVQMQDMFKSYTLKQIGPCKWATNTDIGVMDLNFGDEFSYELIGRQFTEVATHTREGYIAVVKMGDKVFVSKTKCGKQFLVTESRVDGVPGSLVTMIHVRA